MPSSSTAPSTLEASEARMQKMRCWQARRMTRRARVAAHVRDSSSNNCFTIDESDEAAEEVQENVDVKHEPQPVQQPAQHPAQHKLKLRRLRRLQRQAVAPLQVHIPRHSEVFRFSQTPQTLPHTPSRRPYRPHQLNPIAKSPASAAAAAVTNGPLAMPGCFPSDDAPALPPHLLDTPEYWAAVREASVQRSRINPFAEPTHRPVTTTMVRHHIDPGLWYGAAPARRVPVSLTPSADPASLLPRKLSVGAALAAIKSPLLPKHWSPTYTNEELAQQHEEQRPRTYVERVAIAWAEFWGSPAATQPPTALDPPPGPQPRQRPQTVRAQMAMEAADYSPRATFYSSRPATREEFLLALHSTGRFRMASGYGGLFPRGDRRSESVRVEPPGSVPQTPAAVPEQLCARGRRKTGRALEPYERLYANRFDPAHRRRAEQDARLRSQAQAAAAAAAAALEPPQAAAVKDTMHSRTQAAVVDIKHGRTQAAAVVDTKHSQTQAAVVDTVRSAVDHMQANNKQEARAAVDQVCALLAEPLVQELLTHVGLYVATVAVLQFVGLSPGTVLGRRAAEMALVKGFSYVLKPEARVWSLGLK